ncbi:Crp/Fnr family transcriptional regulator [Methylonatrum kenyense]|uniref:Crp/Fnr family transcriptional regulator n=1 Tax=Methylonatrum kenyense TaxID=455253 RepID=UPI0020BFAEB4|nr:Crp/Fnr family transcriptional regulator [Methylonatrum kenyense]MCK8515871.1 Crp/Fnr family transcriptional regulator [Methylonatrum kenyense]
MTETDISGALSTSPLFRSLQPDKRKAIAERCKRLPLRSGTILFHQDDPADRFFLVLSGLIKLFRTSPSGVEKVIHLIGPGETFAEAVMFMEARQYPVTAEATADCELIAIPSAPYREALRTSPQACFRLLADLSARLHLRLHDIDQLTLQQATPRVVHFLLAQADREHREDAIITLTAPKHVLASRLSVTPETLSRILHGLAARGLVRIQGRRIELLEIQRLRQEFPGGVSAENPSRGCDAP